MTPAARIAAAAELLDRVLAGEPAERVLTNWARASRFAGSGDRAAVRDLVFDALRCRRSFAALAGSDETTVSGRALMIGALRAREADVDTVFTGEGHAPAPLGPAERAALAGAPDLENLPELVRLDCPHWLAGPLRSALGSDFGAVLSRFRSRAPVWLRVNLSRGSRDEVRAELDRAGITTDPHAHLAAALMVRSGAGGLKSSAPYRDGHVELQDAGSQAATAEIPLGQGWKVLDYCAGGGGKTLALADRARADRLGVRFHAHDAEPRRMADLPSRAARAGVGVTIVSAEEAVAKAPFDLVVCDVPCSGTGAWRRQPEAKWALTPERLGALERTQAAILDAAVPLVRRDGVLAYLTCSMLPSENEAQLAAFATRHEGWATPEIVRISPLEGGDGFFVGLLRRDA